ncbi:MAG: ABC transporter ATP-binding protein [Acetatifactor sp.]|nr:ABC transporter ATP-binding protein [Acetatifactor sp.]
MKRFGIRSSQQPVWKLWKKEYKRFIYPYGAVYLLQQLLVLVPPYCYLLFLQKVITEEKLTWIPFIFGGYLTVYFVQTFVGYLEKKWYHRIALGATAKWRSHMMKVMERMTFSDLKELESGQRKRMVWDDPQAAVEWAMGRMRLCLQLLGMVPTVAVLLLLDVRLAVPSLCMVPVSLAITRYVRRKSSRFHQVLLKERSDYDGFLFRSLQCWKEIRADNLEEQMERQFVGHQERMGKAFLHTHLFWFVNRTLIAFKDVFLTNMGLYLLGGVLVLYGYSSVAVLLAFMEYFTSAMNTFLAMMDGYVKQGELEPALKRIERWLLSVEGETYYREYANLREDTDFKEHTVSKEHTGLKEKQDKPFMELTAADVSFSYEEKTLTTETRSAISHGQVVSLLQHTSLHLKSGECLVILGKSGSGKSTLARLLVGLLQPEQGEIRYNGLDRSAYADKTFFKQTGIVMQDSYLFNLSIRDNLLIGNPQATEENMWNACEQTCFADFIRTLPQGMETLIGENGIRLSGGQRQRLVLARMLLHCPQILILDEALSALDTDHEKRILQNIRSAMESGILLVITHRRESLKNLGEYTCLEL